MGKKYIPGVESAIRLYMNSFGKTESDLANTLGVTQGAVNQVLKNGFGKSTANKWAAAFGFSIPFLLTGEGQLTEPDTLYYNEEDGIPLIPILAQGGHLSDFSQAVYEYDCERIVTPVAGAEFAIPIYGESMTPEYPSGSIVFVKRIDETAFIEWGKAYLVDTVNGTVIKYLAPGEDGKVRCISSNPAPMYAPFDVAMKDILGVYKIILCLSMK